ncbi:gluconolaconase [Marinobacterium nitratireducens]|uniref:Gluconolaconase n=1 Tax=Marinobacterium nitratireducens TaxID=518897 RepID=A0A917ZH74_9GAMM|nr:SMP-30/gluconolactonase/LRE family protein [Marinobacterium nitratireducens]GGO81737.1 gluconolaconase [Marinobacterium nitratireducens]
MTDTVIKAEGIYFGEGPRWHDGRLWFSDYYDHAIKSMDADGDVRVEHLIDDEPSGLGWLPDGRLLVVSMSKLSVLRQEGRGFVTHADVAAHSVHRCNDMCVDASGRAWVGNFGFDLDASVEAYGPEKVLADHPTANLVRIDPNGKAEVAATDMHFPNGAVVTPDGRTLIVAETLAMRLTAFDIETDGTLSNRRVWADLANRVAPDGICLNADGNAWVANPLAAECLLVAPGGEILESITTTQKCFACALGGDDGRELFMLTAENNDHRIASSRRTGRVEAVRIAVGAAR